jgi:hypothetical protein
VRRLTVVAILIAIAWCFGAVGADTALADTKCQKRNPRTGTCLIVAPAPGHGDGTVHRGGAHSDGDARGATQPAACTLEGQKLPCAHRGGTWSNSHHCYLKVMSHQPPRSDPAWEGHTTGSLYHCFLTDDMDSYPVWLAAPPGVAAPPDPRVLALQAIAAMQLRAIAIGIVPEARSGSVGIVGMPTWLWAEAPRQNTWGPISRTASARGYSVTATAKVMRVVWAMGDGSSVVCTSPGTPYADSFGKRSSPDCGHTYTRQGTYMVRATSYWSVEWAGIGQSGQIPLNFRQTAVITIGEVQVLSR